MATAAQERGCPLLCKPLPSRGRLGKSRAWEAAASSSRPRRPRNRRCRYFPEAGMGMRRNLRRGKFAYHPNNFFQPEFEAIEKYMQVGLHCENIEMLMAVSANELLDL